MIKVPVEYSILQSYSAPKLVDMMGPWLKEGWEPLGGVCYAKKPNSFEDVFTQAVVRYEYVSEMEYSRRLAATKPGSGYEGWR